jgi:CysZ protein
VPLLLTVAALLLASALVAGFAGDLYALATGWQPHLEASAWWAWLWVGPALAGLFLVGLVTFAALAAAILVGALLLASLLAAPFLDALARRVEAVVAGRVEEEAGSGFFRAIVEEARRTAFFLAVQGGLLVFGVLVPGAQLLAAPAMTLFALLFLPLDYASYTLDRRGVRFRDKRRWIVERPALMLGFGSAAFLTCLVPGLNLLAMPVLVTGGTLLALRHPPLTSPRGVGPGTSTSP